MDLRELQTILGHVRPDTTARYAQMNEVTSTQSRERHEQLLQSFILHWRDAA